MNCKQWLDSLDRDIVDTVFKIKIEMPDGKKIIRDFSIDLSIDYDLLEEQLINTPVMFAFISSILSDQKFTCAKLERQIARRKAKIIENAHNQALKDGIKLHKYVLDELVEVDDEILKWQSKLMLAQKVMGKLYGMLEAMRMKSEHLRSLAGFKRQEMRQ